MTTVASRSSKYIKSVKLGNRKIAIESPITIVIGENGCGKTNLLLSLREKHNACLITHSKIRSRHSILELWNNLTIKFPDKKAFLIDDIDCCMHPENIVKVIDLALLLAQQGKQFFIVAHTDLTLRKLYVVACKHACKMQVLSKHGGEWKCMQLLDAHLKIYKEYYCLALD